MENILEDKEIVKIVLSKLSQYGNIPSDGFLCGGAVANILMKLKWGGDYPINDLDIFVETKKYKETSTPTRTDKLALNTEYQHLNASYNHGNCYRIVSSDRDGMINIVKVFRESRDKSDNYMYILKGFDLNCTQVGIDLKTGQMLYTKEFNQFLKDKQLKVVAPYTPAHTAIRLFKKIDELGCYCDVDGQMKLLSQPFNNPTMQRYDRYYAGVFAMFFGVKYKEMYEKYEEQLKPYFRMVSLFDYKKTMWDKKWDIIDTLDGKKKKTEHVLNWLHPNRTPDQKLLDGWAKMNGKIWGVLPVKYEEPDKEFIKIILGTFSPLILMSVWNMLYGGLKKSSIRKVKKVISFPDLRDLCMVVEDFYECDFSDSNLKELAKYIYGNYYFGRVIYKYNLNVQESLKLKNDITKILNKEGEWFSGMIHKLLLTNGHPMVKPNLKKIKELFEIEKVKLTKPIIEGVDLSDMKLPENVDVKELVSEYDLAYAGKKLSNCINTTGQNYKEKIKKCETKIFVITTPNSMSAMEINRHIKDGVSVWRERWTLSYCNKECNDLHKHISMYILSYVQKEMLLVDISRTINKYDNRMSTSLKIMDFKADVSTKDNPVIHENNLGYTFDEILEEIANDVGRNIDEPVETVQTTYNTDDLVFDLTEEGSVDVEYVRTNVVEVDEEEGNNRTLWDSTNTPF